MRKKKPETREWLRKYMSTGPRLARDVIADAKRFGISYKTLNRVKVELLLESVQKKDGWYWQSETAAVEKRSAAQDSIERYAIANMSKEQREFERAQQIERDRIAALQADADRILALVKEAFVQATIKDTNLHPDIVSRLQHIVIEQTTNQEVIEPMNAFIQDNYSPEKQIADSEEFMRMYRADQAASPAQLPEGEVKF